METTAITSAATTSVSTTAQRSDEMDADDFLQLLITQLSNQDPLDPTSSQELLQQISSIRDIELSTTLVDSLATLTGQQRYASAAGLIGNYVVARADSDDSTAAEGVVVGVRFAADGQPFLQLENGQEVSLDQVESVTSADKAAAALVGKMVSGVDDPESDEPQLIEGIVTAVREDADGSVILELDTGQELSMQNILAIDG